MRRVRLLARRELVESFRSYWFLVHAGLFAAGGAALLLFGQEDVAVMGYRGHGRALAGLVQLALVLVPLMAVFPSTAALAGERETGTLDYLLAQPLTRGELFLGKWAGVSAAVGLSLLAGFGLIGLVAVAGGVGVGLVLALAGLSLILGLAFVSLGLFLSARAATRARATSLGLSLWLALVALGSLGVMAFLVRWEVPAVVLQAWGLVNPVEAYRLATLILLDPGLEMLGPVGASLVEALGAGGVAGAATASLLLWTWLAAWAGTCRFRGPSRPGSSRSRAAPTAPGSRGGATARPGLRPEGGTDRRP